MSDFNRNFNVPTNVSSPHGGSRCVPRGRTDGRTDMIKLIVATHNCFAKALKIVGMKIHDVFLRFHNTCSK
jgi:hypothetical protein